MHPNKFCLVIILTLGFKVHQTSIAFDQKPMAEVFNSEVIFKSIIEKDIKNSPVAYTIPEEILPLLEKQDDEDEDKDEQARKLALFATFLLKEKLISLHLKYHLLEAELMMYKKSSCWNCWGLFLFREKIENEEEDFVKKSLLYIINSIHTISKNGKGYYQSSNEDQLNGLLKFIDSYSHWDQFYMELIKYLFSSQISPQRSTHKNKMKKE